MVIGSQAILATWPDSPASTRASPEIDALPRNAAEWQATHGIEASEEINALFGYLSEFHRAHGFYIDGVDESTATFPAGWRSRAVAREIDCDGRSVRIIAPEPHDLALSKLCRLDPRDAAFVYALYEASLLDRATLLSRLTAMAVPAEIGARTRAFIEGL